ncbi:dihydrodipicolinate synthase family protein [Pedobacter changchengzhani]|uniref:Dihydrodipicolinate synthase family protein n=1 Tax=Pedobacter changchengzhani TaxID=2529274 RepID=A0A4R5MIL4_9SPHI|nr:dihydrodipicolinate synthase family protein [Pedobacter changchengzhani]TDG35352.1 dihydrodipicolinate synthase family protein [Pedobacter changchengzhani]
MNTVKKGFIPVMLTPFTHNKEVDYDTLTRLVYLYLDSGAVGLFANCLSSEMFQLSNQERLQITKHIIKIVDNKVPVVATGTFDGSIESKAEFVKQIYDTGIEAVIVTTNSMADIAESDQVFEENFYKLLDITENIPLGFYECPVPYKRLIEPALLGKFINTGRVIYHKDTSLDISLVKQKIEVGKDFNFGLYDAFAGHAVASLKAGSAGLSCIQGNYFPELIVWLCKNFDNHNLQNEVNEVQLFLNNNMDVVHESYPNTAKHFLKYKGININTVSRVNTDVITKANAGKVIGLYQDYELLRQKFEIC